MINDCSIIYLGLNLLVQRNKKDYDTLKFDEKISKICLRIRIGFLLVPNKLSLKKNLNE
jgi:hypothetical protein